jgi:Retroviral aspartyl protease
MDYRPELVVSLTQSVATKRKKIIRALVDTGSSRTIVRGRVLPDWAIGKASKDDPCTYTTLGGTFKTMRKTYVAFQLVQFAPNRTITHDVALLEGNTSTKKDDSRPYIILGRDLIKSLGLTLDFSVDPPVINWEDVSVPVVPRGYWTKQKISEAFPVSIIEQAEQYDSSLLQQRQYGPTYLAPKHLSTSQQQQLLRLL